MHIPKARTPLEMIPWKNWVEKRETDQETLNDAFRAFMARMDRANSAGASHTTDVNVKLSKVRQAVDRISGLPTEDSVAGSALSIGSDGAPVWTPNIAGLHPEYHIHLIPGAPEYFVLGASVGEIAALRAAVPPIVFTDNGHGFNAPLWTTAYYGGEYAGYPVSCDTYVYVYPESADEEFDVGSFLTGFNLEPSAQSFHVMNESSTYTATVRFSGDATTQLIYADGGGILAPTRTLAPRERLKWRCTSHAPIPSWQITPVFGFPNIGEWGDVDPKFPIDFWYWRYVQSRHSMHSFPKSGVLSTSSGGIGFTNDQERWLRFGLVSASVGTAPTGSSILIDVKVDGVSIFATPLEIAAGTTSAVKEPDANTHPNAGGYFGPGVAEVYAGLDSVLWETGARVTVDVVQVGSSTPGSDLNVQVYFG